MDDDVTPAVAYDLDDRTCLGLLATQRIGRLVVGDGDRPAVIPVHFSVTEGSLVVLPATGEDLTASIDQFVLFEVDGVDEHRQAGWSVVIRGRVETVSERETYVSVAIVELSGRWVQGEHGAPPVDGRAYL
jgi:nitroimidazol reductase NimA-like FMN-containing flavoprotein (pyridoxamine 5'-phosphate oxidase superfamily)